VKQDILFISDLHLSLDKPAITRRFLAFLQGRARQAKALYILGDLFDAWVGDDDYTPPNKRIRTALRQLTQTGTQVFLQQGNRDFLLGGRFCQETGISLLADEVVIDLFGTPTLLMHGDLLCTDDLPYQAFRVKAHTQEWQQNILSKPLLVRLLAARWYRLRSFFHKRKTQQDIMDANPDTVRRTLQRHGVARLIHGHTHRPAVHDFDIDGQPAQRFVLAAWHTQAGEALCWSGGNYKIEII